MHKQLQENECQNRAISHQSGPMLVLAGPGSGKTFVITHRVLHLIKRCHVPPQNILVITFTKAAAKEMQERFLRLSAEEGLLVSFGTFHAIFFSILKYSYHLHASSILKEFEKRKIIEKILRSFKLNSSYEMAGQMLSEISKCKNLGLAAENHHVSICKQEEFVNIYQTYQRELDRLGKIDFDDMILKCYELLSARKDILQMWRSKYTYVLVDEFQDINPLQYQIVKLLTAPMDNLFVVGDDDQSIYGFRGTNPKIMQQFRQDYPQSQIVTLPTNYRSTQDIVDASMKLISHNENRFVKCMHAVNLTQGGVRLFCFESRSIQAQNIVKAIQQYMQREGSQYKDIAVIYRVNGNMVLTMQKLLQAGIPFAVQEKPKHLYDSNVAKDILAYLRFSQEQNRSEDFYRIMNKPNRHMIRERVPRAGICEDTLLRSHAAQDNVIHKIIQLFAHLRMLKEMSPYAAINFIRRGIGYDQYVKDMGIRYHRDCQEVFELLDTIQEGAREFETVKQWLAFVASYDEEMNEKKAKQETEDAVCITTMHASKGLEWPFVIIPDLNEGFIPHKKAITTEETEEERRMLYVAMTRAKTHLFLFCINKQQAFLNPPSRFLFELFDDLHL